MATETPETTAALLGHIEARFDAVPSGGSTDLKRFERDLQKALEGLRRLSEELKASFHVCPLICQKLLSPQGRDEYFILLENDERQRRKVKSKLEALGSCLEEAEQVLRFLPGIVAKTPSANRISDAEKRRSVKNILGHYKELRDELLEWKKSAQRSLEKILASGLTERFGIDVSLLEEGGGGEGRGGTATTGAGRSGRRAAHPSVRAAAERLGKRGRKGANESGETNDSHRSPGGEPGERAGGESADGSDPSLRSFRFRLVRWARWRPMSRSRVARNARLSESRRLEVKAVSVRALWGERCATEVTRPYKAEDVSLQAKGSLWDLPAIPPQDFQEGGESTFRVPGGDTVVECDACSRGRGSCRKCEGTGKLLRTRFCDTRYYTQSFSERIAPEDLPARLAAPEEGKKVFQDYVFYPASNSDGLLTHRHRCLEAISEQAGPDVREMLVRRLFSESLRLDDDKERQLIRVGLEIATVPVREYSCEPCQPRRGRSDRRFRAWIYGARQPRLHVEGYPRHLTLKALALLLAIALAGTPVGFLLMRWITTL